MSAGARVLERDRRGDKVLLTPDKHIIKLFYPRRRFTSARLYPYAFRFCNNARRLQALGIITVQCEQLRHDREHGRHLVRYPLLKGDTLRDRLATDADTNALLHQLAGYLAELHARGVLFRSIHLGNILVLEDGHFGLIDIADMTLQRRPLGLRRRARNFRHLLHDPRDRDTLSRYGYARLLADYESEAGLNARRRHALRRLIRRSAPAMTGI